ncbi:hypothetical protein Celaphus_00007375 [Cervus elaphus hippelaphus]|uniref:Uncharacterized protein n=1 Tax=Cervus elaphus hippelaphus TaxID=46360 RepID=A0A212CYI1_CEREH|nr:hypothetical protein Celaphus_00007375 [Cervus elaphus hippelaphus]
MRAGWPRAGCRGFLLLPTPLWSPAKGHIGRLAEPRSPGQDKSAQSNTHRVARGGTGATE